MKRWPFWTLGAVVLVVLTSLAVRHAIWQAGAQQREADYQDALRAYSSTFKVGTNRIDVETHLRRSGRHFLQSCCMESGSSGPMDVLVNIGQESAPLYCSEHNVYIGFQFVAAEPRKFPTARDTDTLRAVRLYHRLEGCL